MSYNLHTYKQLEALLGALVNLLPKLEGEARLEALKQVGEIGEEMARRIFR